MVKIYTQDDPALAQALIQGAVGVLPTDTLYGLVCRAGDESAVRRLYGLKHRSAKPGTVIAATAAQLIALGIDRHRVDQAGDYWPGPVSVELKNHLDYLTQGTGRNAYRVITGPSQLLNMLSNTGPLLTSSANLPGQPAATTVDEARAYFGESVDFYVDGGDLSGSLPSTLVVFEAGQPVVVRPGAATLPHKKGDTHDV